MWTERVLQSMSLLDIRDANGYPPQGYDFVPECPKPKPKDTLSDLVKLLQQVNERQDALKRDEEDWHQAYKSLN